MSRHPFDPGFQDLPARLPIFPLPGALLLPHGQLPLNIFEPRYLSMLDDAIAGNRLIGMVQPRVQSADPGSAPVYEIGCAGRLAAFSETEDGRYLVTLRGICRFGVLEELPLNKGYRSVRPDFARFRADLEPESAEIERDRLLAALKRYFTARELSVDWNAVAKLDGTRLVDTMATVCPFDAPEKQALLEAPDLEARAETLLALLEMAASDEGGEAARH